MSDEDEYSDYTEADVTVTEFKTYSLEKYDERSIYGDGDEETKKHPCEYCGRKFYLESLERHKFPCYRDQEKKRKLQERAAKKPNNDEFMEKLRERRRRRVRNWKSQHIEFISAVQAARDYMRAKETGAPLPEVVPSAIPVDLIQCETCARRFNVVALDKHAPRCKDEYQRRLKESSSAAAKKKIQAARSAAPPSRLLSSQMSYSSTSSSRTVTPNKSSTKAPSTNSQSCTKSSTPTAANPRRDEFSRYVQDQIQAFKLEEAQWKNEERVVRSAASSRALKTPTCYSQRDMATISSPAFRNNTDRCGDQDQSRSTKARYPPRPSSPHESTAQMVDISSLLNNPALLQELYLRSQAKTPVPGGSRAGQYPNYHSPSESMASMRVEGEYPSHYNNKVTAPPLSTKEMCSHNRMNDHNTRISNTSCPPMKCMPTEPERPRDENVNLTKFCHECGLKFPTTSMKFCCKCGTKRQCLT